MLTESSSTEHVMTVRGPIDPRGVGITSMHEHLFVDGATSWWDPTSADDPEFATAELMPTDGGRARWNTFANADNLRLSEDDYSLLADELRDFLALDGSCVVEVTNEGIAPQPEMLKRIAEDLDIHIVAGCGFYIRKSHPTWLDDWSTAQIAEHLESALRDGIDSTGIRPGIIGEIGTSEEVHPVERRVLEAAAEVGARTGTAVNVHTHPPSIDVILDIIETMTQGGLDPRRIYLSHLDEIPDFAYMKAVMDRGVTVGYDSFGQDFYFAPRWKAKSDNERIHMLTRLIDAGYDDQLVLGQDVCMKCMLKAFGGMGYDHVLARVVPRLRDAFGVADSSIEKMLVANPTALLTRPGPGLAATDQHERH